YVEVFGKTGDNPADTAAATPTSGPIVIPSGTINSIIGGVPGDGRAVFRCKTHPGASHRHGRTGPSTPLPRGAVPVAAVFYDRGAGAVNSGDFELAEQGGIGAIDNRFPLPGVLTSRDVWRSTGKPISPNWHAEALANLNYGDLCGPPNSPARQCNIG